MRTALFLSLVLLLCSGCPEAPIRTRRVSLSFPQGPNQSTVTLSVDAAEVQAASRLIDETLTSAGFVRLPPLAEDGAQFPRYSRSEDGALVPPHVSMGLEDHRLVIALVETRVTDSHIRAATSRAARRLETRLVERYGKQRVAVERKTF